MITRITARSAGSGAKDPTSPVRPSLAEEGTARQTKDRRAAHPRIRRKRERHFVHLQQSRHFAHLGQIGAVRMSLPHPAHFPRHWSHTHPGLTALPSRPHLAHRASPHWQHLGQFRHFWQRSFSRRSSPHRSHFDRARGSHCRHDASFMQATPVLGSVLHSGQEVSFLGDDEQPTQADRRARARIDLFIVFFSSDIVPSDRLESPLSCNELWHPLSCRA